MCVRKDKQKYSCSYSDLSWQVFTAGLSSNYGSRLDLFTFYSTAFFPKHRAFSWEPKSLWRWRPDIPSKHRNTSNTKQCKNPNDKCNFDSFSKLVFELRMERCCHGNSHRCSTIIIIIMKHGDLKLCREGSFVHGVRAKKYAVKDVALLCYAVGAVRSFTCWYFSELFFWFCS
jgi:hypothetical protein